jgi:hypothetical protein
MGLGIIIKSASDEVSDAVRDANVKAVIEGAGYELPEPEQPAEPKPKKESEPTPAQRKFERHVRNYMDNQAEIRQHVPDWDKTILKEIPMDRDLQLAIIEAECPEATHFFAAHPDVLERANAAPPRERREWLRRMKPHFKAVPIGKQSLRLRSYSAKPVDEPESRPHFDAEDEEVRRTRQKAAKRGYQAFKELDRSGSSRRRSSMYGWSWK